MFAHHLWITLAEDRPQPHLVYESLRNIWNTLWDPQHTWVIWWNERPVGYSHRDAVDVMICVRLILIESLQTTDYYYFLFSFHHLSVHKHLLLGSQTGWHTLSDHHCLWWGRLTTLTSLTHLASLTQQPDCTECEKPAKYSWLIIWREKKDSLSCVLIFEFPVMCIHPASDWLFSSLFKASRVRPKALTWGQRSVRPTVDTCQQRDAARPGSITGLDYWNNTLVQGGRNLEAFTGLTLTPYTSKTSLIDHNKCATNTGWLILPNRILGAE